MSYQDVINRAVQHVAKGGKFMLRPRCNGKIMSRHFYLNEDHTYKPCDLMTWAKQFEELERHVAEDEINGYRISTVWLGLDHNYYNTGEPLVFETMVFNPSGEDKYCMRYSTWEQAETGHKDAIEWVKNGCKEEDE